MVTATLLGYVNYRTGIPIHTFRMMRDLLGGTCWTAHSMTWAVASTADHARCKWGSAVFSGRLLNRTDLLETHGLPAELTAAETCLKLYGTQEKDFLKGASGAFTAVIVDERLQRLLVARDAIGQRPLYYTLLPNGTVVFCDDLKTLTRCPGVPTQLSLTAVSDFLSLGYIGAPYTIYRDIWKLTAGSTLQLGFRHSLPVITRYWKPQFTPKSSVSKLRDAASETWSRLDKAVNRCLDVAGKSGVLLSGGIDSNVIMALCTTAEHATEESFTVGFDVSRYDERELASLSAKHLKVRNHVCTVTPEDWSHLLQLQCLNGEPFGDSSLIPTYKAAQLAAEHGMKSVLLGSGGDEVFGGYRRYQAMKLLSRLRLIPHCLRKLTGQSVLAVLPEQRDARTRLATIRRFSRLLSESPLDGFASFQEVFSREAKDEILRDMVLREQPSYLERWEKLLQDTETNNFTELFNELDIRQYLSYDCCVKERIALSCAGLEGFSPMLDMDVVDYGLSLPSGLRIGMREGKRVLREIGRGLLPKELLAQSKRGFGMPVSDWLRGPCAKNLQTLATDIRLCDTAGWFDATAIERLTAEHLSGAADHGAQLWVLMCLKTWMEAR